MSDQVMDFTEAYETICPSCGKKAGLHRLTRTGNLYCQQLVGNMSLRQTPYDEYQLGARIPVSYLNKSPLSRNKVVGSALDLGLHSFDTAVSYEEI